MKKYETKQSGKMAKYKSGMKREYTKDINGVWRKKISDTDAVPVREEDIPGIIAQERQRIAEEIENYFETTAVPYSKGFAVANKERILKIVRGEEEKYKEERMG